MEFGGIMRQCILVESVCVLGADMYVHVYFFFLWQGGAGVGTTSTRASSVPGPIHATTARGSGNLTEPQQTRRVGCGIILDSSW